MLVTLALGDSRLVYAVICPTIDDLNSSGAIDESPRIPESLQERTASNVSLPLVPISSPYFVLQAKGRSARRFHYLRYFSLLAYHSTPGRNVVEI